MNFSQQIKKSNTDEWFTMENDVSIILPYLLKNGYKKILCPFDTADSNFVKVLRREGLTVSYSHIQTGIDFFEIHNFDDYDAVVSNPPFSKRQKIFERLFEVKIPFALIMDFNGLFDSKARWRLFKNNKFELLIPCGRMHFLDENKNEKNSPNFQSIYVCHNMLHSQIVFPDSEKEG